MTADIKGMVQIRDKEKVISTLISAFTDYPQLTRAFPDRSRRMIVTEASLRFYVAFGMKYGDAYALSEACQGVAVVISSSKRKVSKLKYFLAGSYSRKYKNTISRLTEEEQRIRTELFQEMTQMETEIKFPSKYIYLSHLGVKTEHQGQGIGSAIMDRIIDYGEKKKLPVVLFTNEPEGVGFYQNMGFKIMGITSSKKFQFINIYLIKL